MSVSRRRFLRSGALGGLAAGLMLKSNSFAFGHDSKQTVDHAAGFDYSRASFEPHVGSTFRLRQGKQTFDLTLVNLDDYQQPSRTARNLRGKNTESFVLAFRAPRKHSLASTYQLEHSKLGKIDIFMERNGDRDKMTAVDNRIV